MGRGGSPITPGLSGKDRAPRNTQGLATHHRGREQAASFRRGRGRSHGQQQVGSAARRVSSRGYVGCRPGGAGHAGPRGCDLRAPPHAGSLGTCWSPHPQTQPWEWSSVPGAQVQGGGRGLLPAPRVRWPQTRGAALRSGPCPPPAGPGAARPGPPGALVAAASGPDDAHTASGRLAPVRAVCSLGAPRLNFQFFIPWSPRLLLRALQSRGLHTPSKWIRRNQGSVGSQKLPAAAWAERGENWPTVPPGGCCRPCCCARPPCRPWAVNALRPRQNCTTAGADCSPPPPCPRRPPVSVTTPASSSSRAVSPRLSFRGPGPVSWECPPGAESLAQTGGFQEGSLEEVAPTC